MIDRTNPTFELRGINHVALVCRDMAKTLEFYRDVLGMPLVKTIDLPGGAQHFFFDVGNGDCIAFFWFPDAPPAAPGIAAPQALPGEGSFVNAHGALNHIAFNVAPDRFDAYYEKLKQRGVKVTPSMDHDDSEGTVAAQMHDGVYVRSVYFFDPDGVCLEFATWLRPMYDNDVNTEPKMANGKKAVGLVTGVAA